MDRVKNSLFTFPPAPRTIVGLVMLMALAILGVKAVDQNWLRLPGAQDGLELNGQPALIIFNSYTGCDCVQRVYRAADYQVSYWPEEDRMGVPVIYLNFDQWSELQEQYDVVRAPTLILVDADGSMIYQQNEIITDEFPLDLNTFEQKIQEILSTE
jgi:hypothetical protein